MSLPPLQQQTVRRLTKHPPPQLPASELKPNLLKRREGEFFAHPCSISFILPQGSGSGSSSSLSAAAFITPLPSPKRPSPARNSSFTKRHASFDSPREVPLPSPSQNLNSTQLSYFPAMGKPESNLLSKSRPTSLNNKVAGFSSVFSEDADDAGWTSITNSYNHDSGGEIPSFQVDRGTPPLSAHSSKPRPQQQNSSSSSGSLSGVPTASQILPFPRPYSLPGQSSSASTPVVDAAPIPPSSSAPDRTSSASLPLPTQIPYHTLPKVGSRDGDSDGVNQRAGSSSIVSDVAKSSTLEEDADTHRPPLRQNDSDGVESSDSRSSDGSLQSASSASNSSRDCVASRAEPPLTLPRPFSLPTEMSASSSSSSDDSYSRVRGISSRSFYQSTTFPSTDPLYTSATALRRSATTSGTSNPYLSPPEPPVILPSPPAIPSSPIYGSITERLASSSPSTSSSSPASVASGHTGQTSSYSSSPPTSYSSMYAASTRAQSSPPPYAPFLSHAPPPADSWIEVETTPSEYRLNVRLPGFQRDGM